MLIPTDGLFSQSRFDAIGCMTVRVNVDSDKGTIIVILFYAKPDERAVLLSEAVSG